MEFIRQLFTKRNAEESSHSYLIQKINTIYKLRHENKILLYQQQNLIDKLYTYEGDYQAIRDLLEFETKFRFKDVRCFIIP